MAIPQIAPYGSWKSPITSDLIVGESIRLSGGVLDGETVSWIEGRPSEGGRNVIVQRLPDGTTRDVLPAPFNARTLVHEYGGGGMLASAGTIYFCNFADQRIYRLIPGEPPAPITPDNGLRYADLMLDAPRDRIICVCEDHSDPSREAVNTLVAVPLDGEGRAVTLAAGSDFYASPRLSPDGEQLVWLTWNHPNMPWDGTELLMADFAADGSLQEPQHVAGGREESIFQPEWSPDGRLSFVSDRSDWWNLYRRERDGQIAAVCPLEAEFGQPQWVFGLSLYAFVSPDEIVCAYTQNGTWHLGTIQTATGQLTAISTPYTWLGSVRAQGRRVAVSVASPTEPPSLALFDLDTRRFTIVRRASEAQIDARYLSAPRAIEFPTTGGKTAHAFYYPPTNDDFAAPAGEKPPLLVMSHGGPVSATTSVLDLEVQYWTSRGFAVLDVNYGGSTGYGRAYRRRLRGQWGVVDVDDCENGARYLVARGLADPSRLAITGGSAGGYTTLCALTFRETFKAGASHFGISDLRALAEDSHKFESHDLENLIGPWPERQDLYRERSPIFHTERLSCPVIFFQGLEDKVVPPNQAEKMVAALRAKGLPVAYITFPGEQHGFRKAENIKRALDGEFYFYSRVFGFTPADAIEPLPIENFPPGRA
jgi:dipeptidyl aminopeptidase/acylaminoacyl peptidase